MGWIGAMAVALVATLLVAARRAEPSSAGKHRERRAHLGLRLRGALAPHPIHGVFVCPDVGRALRLGLRPRAHRPEPLAMFPREASFESHVQDPVLDEAVLPAFRAAARFSAYFRVFQQGSIQTYLLYIFLALIGLLFWR